MTRTLAYRSIPTHCNHCGRNLGNRVTFYCAGHPCDPRKGIS